MPFLTRRHFLNSSVGFAAAMTAGRLLADDAAPAADSEAGGTDAKINMAVIGTGGRGGSHISDLVNLRDHVKLVAICDADVSHMAGRAQDIEAETGTAPEMYQDVRKLLENKNIHAVTIATPNHWHALGAIWAVQAGKDVYVEKPCSHNIHEGRVLLDAARKHDRIVLHGTQSRSMPQMISAMKFLQEGGIGKIFLARGLCYKRRPSIGDVQGEVPIPEGVDYDLWCGPAPLKPLTRKNLHYDWHWIWDYGNGDIGNQGVHQMDVCLWGLGKRELPRRVQSVGGRFGYIDDGETPNTQVVSMEYDDAQIIFEVRGLETKPVPGMKDGVGNVFYGTEGTLVVNGYTPVAYRPNGEPIEIPVVQSEAGGNHMATFVKAIKSRKLDFEQGEIEVGHLSSALCHLGNISQRLGEKAPFNSKSGSFGDDKAAYATLARMEQHLTENGLKLEELDYLVGPRLEFDPKTERFTNNEAANKLLTRDYRAPYIVPEKA